MFQNVSKYFLGVVGKEISKINTLFFDISRQRNFKNSEIHQKSSKNMVFDGFWWLMVTVKVQIDGGKNAKNRSPRHKSDRYTSKSSFYALTTKKNFLKKFLKKKSFFFFSWVKIFCPKITSNTSYIFFFCFFFIFLNFFKKKKKKKKKKKNG